MTPYPVFQTILKRLSPTFLSAPFKYWKAARSPWSLLFSVQNHPNSQPFLIAVVSYPSDHFMDLGYWELHEVHSFWPNDLCFPLFPAGRLQCTPGAGFSPSSCLNRSATSRYIARSVLVGRNSVLPLLMLPVIYAWEGVRSLRCCYFSGCLFPGALVALVSAFLQPLLWGGCKLSRKPWFHLGKGLKGSKCIETPSCEQRIPNPT